MNIHEGRKRYKHKKFNPVSIGFKRSKRDKDHYTLFNKQNHPTIRLAYTGDWNSLPVEWIAYKVIYHIDGSSPSDIFCYQGAIPSISFARQLIKNILP